MRLATAVVALLALAACGDPCTNRERERLRSPNGTLDAVVFARACGATTGVSAQVAIVPRSSPVVGLGNTFAAEGDVPIEVRWTGPATLLVRYRRAGEVSRREQVGDVRVTYDTTTPPTQAAAPVPAPAP